MIIVHSEFDGLVGVYLNGFEYGLTNKGGTLYMPNVDRIVVGSGAVTNTGWADLSVVSVDSGGSIGVTVAPDAALLVMWGFMAAFSGMGVLMLVRWASRVFHRAAKVPVAYD